LKCKLLPKQEIFNRLFLGRPVLEEELFSTIKAFTPCGMPKLLKKTPENLKKFESYLESKRRRNNIRGLHLEGVSEQESYTGSSVSLDSDPPT
jgi:hypothetical protein